MEIEKTMKRTMLGQARVYSNGGCGEKATVHIQIVGPAGNRGYGFAATGDTSSMTTSAVNAAVAALPAPLPSLAGTGKPYAPVAVVAQKRAGELSLSFGVAGSGGRAFTGAEASELAGYILANGF